MKRQIPYSLLIRDNFHQLVMSNSLLGMVFACSVVSQHFPTPSIREIVLIHLYVYLKLSLYITDVDIKVYLHQWIETDDDFDTGAKYHIPAFFFWTISARKERSGHCKELMDCFQAMCDGLWIIFEGWYLM